MKTLICLVLFALVASTYAAPASLEEMQAELRKMQQHAQIEGFFSSLKNIAKKVAPYAKKGLDLYNKVNGGAELQDDDDDDDIAQMEAYLSNMQRQAEIEGFFSSLKNIAKKVAPYAKKGLDIYNKVNGGAEIQQDDDDDDIAQLQAFLSNMDEAEQQNFWSTLGKIGKGALSLVGKK